MAPLVLPAALPGSRAVAVDRALDAITSVLITAGLSCTRPFPEQQALCSGRSARLGPLCFSGRRTGVKVDSPLGGLSFPRPFDAFSLCWHISFEICCGLQIAEFVSHPVSRTLVLSHAQVLKGIFLIYSVVLYTDSCPSSYGFKSVCFYIYIRYYGPLFHLQLEPFKNTT